MNWKELLKEDIEAAYKSTEGLMEKVSDEELSWKPSEENNWMTMGQLLLHIDTACGVCFQGFVTGEWPWMAEGQNLEDLKPEDMGLPEGKNFEDLTPEEMLPPAEKLPAVESAADAKKFLAEDKQIALDMLGKVTEDELANKVIAAPWDPTERILGKHLLGMVMHLTSHKHQLFYYLKLQGKPVNTADLW